MTFMFVCLFLTII